MSDDPHKIDTSSDAASREPAVLPLAEIPPPQKKGIGKNALFLLLFALVIALAGGYYAWSVMTPKKAAYDDTSTARKIPQFYLASDTASVRVFNPTDRRLSSRKIQAGEKERFSGRSAYANQFLQMSSGGDTIAYLTDEYNYDTPHPGDGVRGPTGHFLYVIRRGNEAKQIMDAAKVGDWILSADGSIIYYLTQSEGDSGPDFHVRGVDNGKDILVEKDIFSDSVAKKETPMLLADDGSVRMYATYANGIREYRYQDTFVTSKRWTTTEYKGCKVAFGSPLSPDGKSLVLRGIEQTGEVSLNILDLTNGKIRQMKRTDKMSEQYNDIYWSPDGSAIAYSVGPYGAEAQKKVGFLDRFEIYDLKTKAVTIGYSNPSPGVNNPEYAQHSVGVLGWSPDGSVIAFDTDSKVKMYAVATKRVTDTGLAYESWKNPAVASGWYTVWQITKKLK